MIKKLAFTLALAALTVSSYGQGQVNFNTFNVGTAARVTDSDGTTFLTGTGWYAELYAADGSGIAAANLTAKGNPVNFRAGSFVGYVQTTGTSQPNGIPVVTAVTVTPSAASSTTVTIQLRAWDSTAATYELAVSGGKKNGASATINIAAQGPGGGAAPDLTGLTGFSVGTAATPEPSTIALGVMGLGAFMMRRRKQ